jgi:signal transduction histidine kinase
VAILHDAQDQQLLLAARPPSKLHRRLAYSVIACLLAAFCVTVPYSSIQLPIVTPFIPIYASVILVNDLITAALLFAQFWVVRWTWLLVLANGYFFTALILIPFALTFPDIFAPSGLLGAGLQTASSLSVCLHMGILIFVIVAMLIRGSHETIHMHQRAPGQTIGLSIALVIAIVCGLTWAVISYDAYLPKLFLTNVYLSTGASFMLAPIIALNIIALVLLVVRGRSVLELWLTVMCCSWLIEVLLGGLFAGSRYSLGWYTGRVFQMAATYIVLLLLLSETTALYANLARASIQRRGARQARQIAVDTMAASIAHEIKQPLTAAIANAYVGMRQLKNAEPDLAQVRAVLTDIGEDCRRIGDIIGSVRTMFQKSTHDRRLLDINRAVRDALAAVELDLRLQRVIVKTDLNNDLPPVVADSGQLHQVFLNLISNALEAMSEVAGRPSVLTIRSGRVTDSSDIAVTVEDTGIGMAGLDGHRIFEPFFSTKAAGTGVGLTICKVIIEAHGGSLQHCANEPYGTIFRVTLPTDDHE